MGLPGNENPAYLWATLWKFYFLFQFSLTAQNPYAASIGKTVKFKKRGDNVLRIRSNRQGSWAKPPIKLMENTKIMKNDTCCKTLLLKIHRIEEYDFFQFQQHKGSFILRH